MTPAVDIDPRPLEPRDNVLVLGIQESGKSHYVKRWVEMYPRKVVWDPHGEYVEAGCELVSLARFHELGEARRLGGPGPLALAVREEWVREKDAVELFEHFHAVVRLTLRNCVLVIEELDLLPPAAYGFVTHLATQSRHYAMPVIFVAQRATMIPKSTRALRTRCIAFRQTEQSDVEALAEFMGPQAHDIPTLPQHQCVRWHISDAFNTTRAENN